MLVFWTYFFTPLSSVLSVCTIYIKVLLHYNANQTESRFGLSRSGSIQIRSLLHWPFPARNKLVLWHYSFTSVRDERDSPIVFVWNRWIVRNFWCCSTGYSIVSSKGWKGRRCKAFERKKEQNETEHGESAMDGMHVLVNPLGLIDSVLYSVFASDCKQRTALIALPLRSSYSRHTLHVIESRDSTPNYCPFGLIRIEATSRSGLIQTGSKSIWLEPVYM